MCIKRTSNDQSHHHQIHVCELTWPFGFTLNDDDHSQLFFFFSQKKCNNTNKLKNPANDRMVGVKMFFSLSLRFHCNYVFFMAMIQCTLPVNKTKKYSNGWVHFSTLHIIIPYNCVFLLKTLFGVRPSLSIEVKWRFKIL